MGYYLTEPMIDTAGERRTAAVTGCRPPPPPPLSPPKQHGAPKRAGVLSTKYNDSEVGLVYYGYRYYSPALGRWISRDPVEEIGGANLTLFCGTDGLNGVDTLGLEKFAVLFIGDSLTYATGGYVGYKELLKAKLGTLTAHQFEYSEMGQNGARAKDIVPRLTKDELDKPKLSGDANCPGGMIIFYWIGINDVGDQAGKKESDMSVEAGIGVVWSRWNQGRNDIKAIREPLNRQTLFVAVTLPQVTDQWRPKAPSLNGRNRAMAAGVSDKIRNGGARTRPGNGHVS